MKIEFNDREIDVKDIMKQIKVNLSNRGYKKEAFELPQNTANDFTAVEEHQYILNRIWSYSADNPIFSHRKYIGKAITFGKKVVRKMLRWYMNPVVEKQVDFNAQTVRMLNEMVDVLKRLEALTNKPHAINTDDYMLKSDFEQCFQNMFREVAAEYEKTVGNMHSAEVFQQQFSNLETAYQEMAHRLEHLQSRLDEHMSEIVAVREEGRHHGSGITEIKDNLHVMRMNFHELQERTNQWISSARISAERLRRIERNLKNTNILKDDHQYTAVQIEERPIENETKTLDFDYFLFEEYYRGTREQIKEKQSNYLNYFKSASHVLDLGCGRGEFTELLLEKGISVTSVDLNDDMVSYCRDRGFPVVQADILQYLHSVDNNSVDGVFLSHVIEHLSVDQLIELVKISYQKLKPTGWFIAETPNPQTMSVFTQSFYMDPTHVKPVHPLTIKFICETAGFNRSDLHYLSPNDGYLQLPKLEANGLNIGNLDQFNETIEHWNRIIFGCQDYYIAAQK